ncbi:hypothetical protein MMC10_001693 [Thelotrema lepadinum]|nr:hypothetical protein [Thelotrema lepadinum]
MTTPKSILVIGLTVAHAAASDEIRNEGKTAEVLREKIQASLKKCQDAGYEVNPKQFPSNSLSTTALPECKELLGSKKWDGVIIGFGIRGVPECTEFFEKLVNAAREIVPGAPFGFNTRPDDLYECLLRNF